MFGIRLTLASLVAAALPATASAQTLTFEGITTGTTGIINNFYNGGGGPNYGIAFTPGTVLCLDTTARQCSDGSRGGIGDPASQNYALWTDAVGQTSFLTMNRTAGFTNGFSFVYAAPVVGSTSFNVWSGLNGTGTLLASLVLPTTPSGSALPNCFGASFCPFVPASIAFAGTAQSVTITGPARGAMLDDITFTPAAVVPEPTTWALMLGGLAGVGLVAYRQRHA